MVFLIGGFPYSSGLLLERSMKESGDEEIERVTPDEDEREPTLFSLLDPLDEVKPFSYQYLPDPNCIYSLITVDSYLKLILSFWKASMSVLLTYPFLGVVILSRISSPTITSPESTIFSS